MEVVMFTVLIKDEAWEKLYYFLRSCDKIYTKDEARCRIFVEAVVWMARSGTNWRYLPEKYGKWNSVYKRFDDWTKKDIWTRMFLHFSQANDLEYIIIDSTIVRANACAAGAKGGAMKPWDEVKAG
jgi:transposase